MDPDRLRQLLDEVACGQVSPEAAFERLRRLLEVVNTCASVRADSPDAVLKGRAATLLRGLHVLTFGGGTNELQRDLIALFGLNMPPSPR